MNLALPCGGDHLDSPWGLLWAPAVQRLHWQGNVSTCNIYKFCRGNTKSTLLGQTRD